MEGNQSSRPGIKAPTCSDARTEQCEAEAGQGSEQEQKYSEALPCRVVTQVTLNAVAQMEEVGRVGCG